MLPRMPHDLTPAAVDGAYPRPQLVRARWHELDGTWAFAFDPDDVGREQGWAQAPEAISGTIVVPFPPESSASGIGDTIGHRVMWYRRSVTADEVSQAGHRSGRRLVLHFGAVDYRCEVWIDGQLAARHEGGHTPFRVEIPAAAAASRGFDVVVRVEDEAGDLAQPRGKQDWQARRHVVWYDRTSGIWQPVWLESVPQQHVRSLVWRPDVPGAAVALEVELAHAPAPGTRLRVTLHRADAILSERTIALTDRRTVDVIALPPLRNGQDLDAWLWSPERPNLIDATLVLEPPHAEPGRADHADAADPADTADDPDTVRSYFGLRSVGTADGRFLVNGRPYRIRGVLSQGYWPQSHLAAPGPDALRAEVQLAKDLGFNTVRVHQKIEDPRFLYWADRLGLLVWAEMPSVYEFSTTSARRIMAEWTDAVTRDLSHPSIAVWVPLNESWGVNDVATEPRQQELARALGHLTRTLDGTRLVVSNDGWEHLRSDLFTVHDYENDAERLLHSYGTEAAVAASLDGIAPNGKRMLVGTPEEQAATAEQPVVLSEFGGVSVDPADGDAWGYRLVESQSHLEEHLTALFTAVHESAGLAGWCYTQLTDTAQETNGLADENRVPKLPIDRLRAIVEGTPRPRPAEPVFGGEAALHQGG